MPVNETGALPNLEKRAVEWVLWILWTSPQMVERGDRPRIARQPEHQSREQLMTIHSLPPKTDLYDAAVEDAIATCNSDLRGALKALLILNEHLETKLMELRAAMDHGKSALTRSRH